MALEVHSTSANPKAILKLKIHQLKYFRNDINRTARRMTPISWSETQLLHGPQEFACECGMNGTLVGAEQITLYARLCLFNQKALQLPNVGFKRTSMLNNVPGNMPTVYPDG